MLATHSPLSVRFFFALVALVLSIALASCAATRGRRGEPEQSGFLDDYSRLEEREGYEERLIYIDPGVKWSRYDAVQVDSVTLWIGEEAKLSPEDQKMLTSLLYVALVDKVGEKFEIVDHPGPDTLRLRAALTEAKGAKVPVRAITSIHPGTVVIGHLGALATDTAATVGEATVEMELRDAITQKSLAASVDQRAGTKVLFLISPKRTFTTWADVEAAADYWAERVQEFLVRQGVRQKS